MFTFFVFLLGMGIGLLMPIGLKYIKKKIADNFNDVNHA